MKKLILKFCIIQIFIQSTLGVLFSIPFANVIYILFIMYTTLWAFYFLNMHRFRDVQKNG